MCKCLVDLEWIECMVFGLVCWLESMGEMEILLKVIGEFVMEGLVFFDMVVYVWYVLVYKNFWEVCDFEEFLGDIIEVNFLVE